MEPGPGGDPIRNPMVLPTGKNIHALDPQSIPTQAALKSARVVVERCALHHPQEPGLCPRVLHLERPQERVALRTRVLHMSTGLFFALAAWLQGRLSILRVVPPFRATWNVLLAGS